MRMVPPPGLYAFVAFQFVVFPTKSPALLLLSGVPTGTSLFFLPLALPLESNPLSHSAYCTTFSIPVFVLFSVFVGLCF